MEHFTHKLLFIVSILLIIFIGREFKKKSEYREREAYLIFKIDSLQTEIKKLNYESTRTGR